MAHSKYKKNEDDHNSLVFLLRQYARFHNLVIKGALWDRVIFFLKFLNNILSREK